jgi:hypothetical protein
MVTTTISTTLIFVISWPQVAISDSGLAWCVELSPPQRSDLGDGAAYALLADDVAEVEHRPRHVPSHQYASFSPTPDSMKFRSALRRKSSGLPPGASCGGGREPNRDARPFLAKDTGRLDNAGTGPPPFPGTRLDARRSRPRLSI